MADSNEIFSGLYLPVADKYLLVPNVSVAEIVDFQQPVKEEGTPDWLLGTIQWRGLSLPVISYPAANEEDIPSVADNARIAVINTISEHHEKLPFFAMLTQGIPRQVKIDEKSIEKDDTVQTGPADLMAVKVVGDEAIIPNFDYLESLAVTLMD